MTETLTGTDRSAGISYDELFDADTRPVSPRLRRVGEQLPPGNTRVPAGVYYDKAIHDLEVEKLWSKVWQLACLEEEIPEVGDYHVYDIAHLSFLIVRTGTDEIKAYRNACLHRGRKSGRPEAVGRRTSAARSTVGAGNSMATSRRSPASGTSPTSTSTSTTMACPRR